MRIKYSHLLRRELISKYTKSKNLHIYLFFIDFLDPSVIPFKEIARETGEALAKVRGMMKNARSNEKISLGLVDVGVDPADIPEWFARPPRLKLKSKRPAVNKLPTRTQPPTELQTRPIQVAKKYIIPTSQNFGAQPISRYEQNFYESRNTPEMDEILHKFVRETQRQMNLDIEEHLEEQKNRKTPREIFAEHDARIAAQNLERSLENQRQRDRFLKYLIYEDLTRERATRDDAEALVQGFQDVTEIVRQSLTRQPNEKRKVDMTPVTPQNKFPEVQDRIDKLLNEPKLTKADVLSLKKIFEDNRKRNQQIKIARHGYLLNPIVNLFPHLTPIVEIDPRKTRKKKR